VGGAREERLTSPCPTAGFDAEEPEPDVTGPEDGGSERGGANEEGDGPGEEGDGPGEEADGPGDDGADDDDPGEDGDGPGDDGPGDDGPGEDGESNDDGDDRSAGDVTGGREDGGGKDGTDNPASASLVPVRVECIADPVTPDDADFATPSRPGSCPLTAAPPNSPSTSAPAPRSMSPYGLPWWPFRPTDAPDAANPPANPPAVDMPSSLRLRPSRRPDEFWYA